MPIIIYVCAIGAYAVNNRMIDIYYMIMFGVSGICSRNSTIPIAPMVLALVLGRHGGVRLAAGAPDFRGQSSRPDSTPDRVADHDRGGHHLLLAVHLGIVEEETHQALDPAEESKAQRGIFENMPDIVGK